MVHTDLSILYKPETKIFQFKKFRTFKDTCNKCKLHTLSRRYKSEMNVQRSYEEISMTQHDINRNARLVQVYMYH